MADDLRLNIVTTADSKGLTKAADDLKDTKAEADKLGKSFDDLGDRGGKLETDVTSLTEAFTEQRDGMRVLRAEYERTQKQMAEFELGGGSKVSRRLPQLDFSSLAIGRGALMPAVIGLVAAAAPAIGAMVGGAVLGGVTTGGVIGGVVAATKDPRVKQAWQDMLGRFDASDFGGDAMAQPVIDSLGRIGTAVKSLGLDEALSKGGPALEELTDGAIRFMEGVMPGVNAVMADSGKIAGVMGDGFATVGESLGDMIVTINSSEGALMGLEMLFDGVGWAARTTGDVVKYVGDGLKGLATISAGASGAMEDVVGWVPGVGDMMRGVNDVTEDYAGTNDKLSGQLVHMGTAAALASRGLDPFSAYLKSAANNAHALNLELKELFGGTLAVDEATIAFEDSVDDLADAIKENGTSIDARTEKGRAVRGAILDEITAAMDLREANIKAGMSTADANKLYEEQINKLERDATAAGIAKDKLLALTGNYHVSVIYTISTRGSVPKFVGANFSEPAQDAMGAGRRASGGPVTKGMPYVVGDGGRPEWFVPGSNGHVYPSVPSMAGGAPTRVEVVLSVDRSSPHADFGDALLHSIRYLVRVNGGTPEVLGMRVPSR
mgnify:CR=1 FL=1